MAVRQRRRFLDGVPASPATGYADFNIVITERNINNTYRASGNAARKPSTISLLPPALSGPGITARSVVYRAPIAPDIALVDTHLKPGHTNAAFHLGSINSITSSITGRFATCFCRSGNDVVYYRAKWPLRPTVYTGRFVLVGSQLAVAACLQHF